MDNANVREMSTGAPVEVRTRFIGRWARGFVVAGREDDRYLVRRVSDGEVLPAAFPAQDVRAVSDR